MRGQIQVIASLLAFSILVFAIMVLYVNIYSYTTSFSIHERAASIYSIVKSRPSWNACDLAKELRQSIEASYVYVNITEVNILSGDVVKSEECSVNTSTTSQSLSYRERKIYYVGTPTATVIIYTVEVEY